MIGIYKITNMQNGHCYIGQSRCIEKRWSNHKIASHNENDKTYNYPLYKAFRKYGIDNFIFEVLEECKIEKLNEKEAYYISLYKPEYNQTEGGDYKIVPQKLNEAIVEEIRQILINDPEGLVSHKELAEKYGVHKDTIRDINVGRTWFNDKYTYPLHYSKFDSRKKSEIKYYCCDCGKEISKGAIRCCQCNGKINRKSLEISREELKSLIKTLPFTTIGDKYNVSDNAVRKWCIKYNLPKTKKEINNYSDEEWANI